MTFFAGIVDINNSLDTNTRNQFLADLEVIGTRLPWDLNIMAKENFVLAQAGFCDMWQGPKLISGPDCAAVATGLQWRKIQHSPGAIDYLSKVFRGEETYRDQISN